MATTQTLLGFDAGATPTSRAQRQPIAVMHRAFGPGPAAEICAHCRHLAGRRLAKAYWKCLIFGVSSGPATDWRKRWPACGKFAREDGSR